LSLLKSSLDSFVAVDIVANSFANFFIFRREYFFRSAQPSLTIFFWGGGQYLVENHPTKPSHIQYNDSLVLTLQEGSFFGEIALLSGKPRQATVKASGVVSVLVIGRDAFDRLCGSLFDILQRNISSYSNIEVPEPEAKADESESKGLLPIASLRVILFETDFPSRLQLKVSLLPLLHLLPPLKLLREKNQILRQMLQRLLDEPVGGAVFLSRRWKLIRHGLRPRIRTRQRSLNV
jgi:hypothetical protein